MSTQEIATGAEAASEIARQAASVPAFSWSGYFTAIAVICLFLGALWIGLRFLKKSGSLRVFGISGEMVVESRISLGPKKNMLLVRVRDKRLLLGVTDHHISKLTEFSLDEDEDPEQLIPRERKKKFSFRKSVEQGGEALPAGHFQPMLENADEKTQ